MRWLIIPALLAGCAYGDGAIGYQTTVNIYCVDVVARDGVCSGTADSRADPTTNVAPMVTW